MLIYVKVTLGRTKFLEFEEVDEIAEAIQKTIDEDVAFAKGGMASRSAKMVGQLLPQITESYCRLTPSSVVYSCDSDRSTLCEQNGALCLTWQGRLSRKT